MNRSYGDWYVVYRYRRGDTRIGLAIGVVFVVRTYFLIPARVVVGCARMGKLGRDEDADSVVWGDWIIGTHRYKGGEIAAAREEVDVLCRCFVEGNDVGSRSIDEMQYAVGVSSPFGIE